jgi:DNA-binding transcriptional MerR regulator
MHNRPLKWNGVKLKGNKKIRKQQDLRNRQWGQQVSALLQSRVQDVNQQLKEKGRQQLMYETIHGNIVYICRAIKINKKGNR